MFGIHYTTMLINLKKSESELWEQIGNLRTDIRKGEKNNTEVSFSPSSTEIQDAYGLYLTMMKKNFLPVLKNYSLLPSENKKVIVAKKEGKVISYISFQLYSSIDTLGKTKICALESIATDEAFLKYSPNTLLYWQGILHMKSLGFEYLNFNGVFYQYGEKEFHSLTYYKRKWNGLEIPLFSQKSFFGYIYWRFFRPYIYIRKIVYTLLLHIFPGKFLKY